MDSYNLTHTGAELDSAVGRALEGFAAADAATKAANDAAKLAEDTAAEVQKKLDNGEFVGPIGKSGVYVGSGDMPEGYTVQVDPTGDMLCYTAGESDSRYLRATEIRRPFTGGGITLTDADDAAFGGVTVLGATTEAGTGDKGPDNPYALTGVQPTSLTVCGKNLCPPTFYQGAYTTQAESRIRSEIIPIVPHVQYVFSVAAGYSALNVYFLGANKVGLGWLQSANNTAAQLRFTPNKDTYRYAVLVVSYPDQTTPIAPDAPISAQLEFGTAATPYEPYTGQTVHLPALEPLYGAGDIRDEYDAATGVETRRWKRVVFDGTEKWNKWREDVCIYSLIRPALVAHQGACNAYPIFKSINWNAFPDRQFSIETKQINFRNDACADVDSWKAYLNAQATAGTPVTVVYQLDAPVVTQHGPQRIPTYPGYTNLMMDISAEGAVQYPISAAMQWDAKADKAAVYDRDTADSRFAGVLTGTASGPVAALEDVSPTGALRRAAVLGATAETGSGDKGPDNPYTLAGVQPTKVTVCGRNLAANPRFNAADQFSPCVYADCELQPNTKYTISLYVPAGEAYYTNENLFAKIVYLPVSTGGIYSAEATTKPTISNTDPKQYATGKGWTLLKAQSGTTASGNARDLQIEFGDTATPYEPYTGQTITLPALASLYGDGTVCDEYDVVSGVETRRWKRVVFDGTENWGLSRTESGNNRYFIRVPDAVAYNLLSQIVCSHWPSIGPGQTWQDKTGITLSLGNADKNIWIYDPRFAQADLPTFKAWLAAQYAAGTPVTVVYQLDAPAVTQHDPARILPPAPVCRVFADAGGVDVGYNRDINIAFEQQQAEYIAQIKALDARIAKLETGQPAEPMT